MNTRHCHACDKTKPLNRFYKRNRRTPNGTEYSYYDAKCRDCQNAEGRKRYREVGRFPVKDPNRYSHDLFPAKGWGWTPNEGKLLHLEAAKNAWRGDL